MTISDARMRNRILAVLFIGVLMGALDIAIVAPALPAIQSAFGVNDRWLAWTFTIYVLFNLIGTPLMAKLSDIFGRRSVYVVDVALFAMGSLLVALSPAYGVLLAGRALQGFGAGGIFPVASAVIGDSFPAEKRGSALGLIGAVFGLAFLVGPILGAILLKLFGWQALFLVNLPVALLVIGLSLAVLPATQPARRKAMDWQGMMALGLALAGLTYGINQIDTGHAAASLVSPAVLPFLLVAFALLALFVWIEGRAADPVLPLPVLGTRQAVLAAALSAGAGLGEAGLAFIPQLAVAALHVGKAQASYMLMPVVLAMMVGSPLAGRLLDRMGSKPVVLTGSGLLAAGMLLLGLAPAGLPAFLAAGAVIGFGLAALLGAPMRYIMLNEAPPAFRAAAQGAVVLFGSIGQLVSGALVGATAASRGGGASGYAAAYVMIGAVAIVLTLLATGLKNREQELAGVQRHESVSAPA